MTTTDVLVGLGLLAAFFTILGITQDFLVGTFVFFALICAFFLSIYALSLLAR